MAPGPKTTWEDLSNLGWTKQSVYNILNPQRGNTMHSLDDLALNEGFASANSWYCYNVLHGSPYAFGLTTDSVSSSTIIWEYDNSQNVQPFSTTVTETWTSTNSATLSISISASIELGASVTIPEVGGSDFKVTIGTEATSSVTEEDSYQLSQTWTIDVGANETVKLERVKTTTKGTATYNQKYGLSDSSWIGTKGDEYDGYEYWGFNANNYLSYPEDTMSINGYSEKTNFTFKIIRISGSTTSEAILRPNFALHSSPRNPIPTRIEYAQPGTA